MKEIKEVNFSDDLHISIESGPQEVLITFKDGNKLRISWDLMNTISEYVKETRKWKSQTKSPRF